MSINVMYLGEGGNVLGAITQIYFQQKKIEENGCRSNSTEIKKQFSPRGNRFWGVFALTFLLL